MMATLIETAIKLTSFRIYKDEAGKNHAIAHGETLDEAGNTIRTFEIDVLEKLSAEQKSQLVAIRASILVALHEAFGIAGTG